MRTRPTAIDRHTFFSGLMLALRTYRSEFQAEGPRFHQAFQRLVDRAKADHRFQVEGIRWMTVDPIFGVVHAANEMVLEAEQDRLVSLLNPHLRHARFKVSREQATRELEQLAEKKDWFLDLANQFNKDLSQQ